MKIQLSHVILPVLAIVATGWAAVPNLDGATLIRLEITREGRSVARALLTCRSRDLGEITSKLPGARFKPEPGVTLPASGRLEGRICLWVRHTSPLRKYELDALHLVAAGGGGTWRLGPKEQGRLRRGLGAQAEQVTLRTARMFHERMRKIAATTQFGCTMSLFRPWRAGLQRDQEDTGVSWVFQPPPKQPGMVTEHALVLRLEPVRRGEPEEGTQLGVFDTHAVVVHQQGAVVGGNGTTTEALVAAIKKMLAAE